MPGPGCAEAVASDLTPPIPQEPTRAERKAERARLKQQRRTRRKDGMAKPATRPISIPRALRGVAGVLNGGGPGGGSHTVDPRHGELADHAFHPVSRAGRTDEEIIAAIRSFATTYTGRWRWSTKPTVNCRSFQADLLAAAGLAVPDGYAHTAGAGCPFLARPRRWRRQIARRRADHDGGRRPVRRPRIVVLAMLALLFVTGRRLLLHPVPGQLVGVGSPQW